MAAQGSELYYTIFLLSSKHDKFYFDYPAINSITLCVFMCFIAGNNFTFNLTTIKELIEVGIRGISPGDWAKCVEHVLSV